MPTLTVDQELAAYWDDFLAERYDLDAAYDEDPLTDAAPIRVTGITQDHVDNALPEQYRGNTTLHAPTGLYDDGSGGRDCDRLMADVEGALAYAMAAGQDAAHDPVQDFFDRQ